MKKLNNMPTSAGTSNSKTKTKRTFALLLLLCAFTQGAWAQTSWDEVYAMTTTTSANWTELNVGSSTGKTLGAAGTTTYYYASANLSFTNSTAGGSGMTIQGTVYLYLPEGVTVTCAGANADGITGAGAGIELTAGNALCLLGQGTLNATGGNAANGGNGGTGGNADWDNSNYWSGTGGTGGNGGGGAGAGIGTRGGDGGNGGDGAANKTSAWSTNFGGSGSNGEAGATAGAMGGLCVSTSFGSLTATGGSAASASGSAGSAGKSYLYDGTYNYGAAGGGGGGGGGFGGAASNIGTGGPGGGGGGGGASGNLDYASTGYWVVKAPGGKGGQNADGTSAAEGAESILNHNALNSGQAASNYNGWGNYDAYVSSQGVGIGGSGSAAGNASTSESAININTNTALPTQEEWEVVCAQTNTSQSQWTALPFETSMGATIGTEGATTYYYATGDRTFINANVGGSGLTIQGTVYLFIASGQTITCKGANASGQTGAGAGIELTEGNVLFLLGQGNVNATGGNAAGGDNGGDGSDAGWDNSNYWSGTGGNGGNGGGGAGAGIGTRGGDGGNGGGGAASVVSAYSTADGRSGVGGQAGATAGLMGNLYKTSSFGSLSATGGSAASTSGSAGRAGKSILDDDTSNNYGAAGGGGGGGGGFGGAASNIGTGGPGGGGGGGGASGNLDWAGSGYYVVKAPGGKGGQNADGTWAAEGAESILNYNAINNGQVISNSNGWSNSDSYVSNKTVGTAGSGGSCGNASSSESAIDVNIELPTQSEWDMVCLLTNTNQSQWAALHFGSSTGATIGTAGNTTYYFATGDRTFTNINDGGSGLTIQGTVYLFIPSGNQITCTGANANGATGGGAGIELTEGNTLYLIGGGELVGTGGNAASSNGTNGVDASFVDSQWVRSGDGGRGGDGGGGAGAGIGTRGGNGGAGGAGGAGIEEHLQYEHTGNAGSNGADGATAASMGTLYVYQMPALTMEIHGGSSDTQGGNGGTGGLNALCKQTSDVPSAEPSASYTWTAGGGGGGGAGGFGGAASDIGTGGPGGGGGGGGASGTIQFKTSNGYFYQVGAFGGNPGINADGTPAGAGESTEINSDNSNLVCTPSHFSYSNLGWYNGDNRAAGGNGGIAGGATQSGSAIPVEVVMRTVEGYGESTASDHWAFIASPVEGSIEATAVGNIFSATQYDLYRFNPSADLEWENWKDNANFHFNLENGRGYLYATKETKTLVFSGNYNTGDTKTIESLPQGFNLVGNPFIVDAYIYKPYYTLDGDGSVILANPQSVTTPISPCHGVIVETDGSETVTFTTTAPAQQNPNNGSLQITLSQAVESNSPDSRFASLRGTKQSSILDNAIITFNEGTELGKYYFGTQAANICIPKDGKDYAIASIGRDGVHTVSTEIPINFKAEENGTYTLSFSLENMDADYLHLIDNLTDEDVDLLSAGDCGSESAMTTEGVSYTFTAKTTDYASRFRLVFAAAADETSANEPTFAYISNGNIIINEADAFDASLQVVDAMGRVVISVGGRTRCVPTSGMTPGIYVLRLINGDDVKTQKIVVE